MTASTCAWCGERFEQVPGQAVRFCNPECGKLAYYRRLLFERVPLEYEQAPVLAVRTAEEAERFLALAGDFMSVKAEVIFELRRWLEVDERQMAEAESTGRTVWRYWGPEETELRERWIALRELSDNWGDYV